MTAILDRFGAPIKAQGIVQRGMPFGRTAYEAASYSHQDLAGWLPRSVSGQSALTNERELITDRVQDIARNDGWASASMSRSLDLVVGSGWRLSVDLPATLLNLEPDEADAISDQIEEAWTAYAEDPGFWCNASRQGPMAAVLGLAYRQRIGDGEALAEICWDENRGGQFATFVKMIDPDRLSNPNNIFDTADLRAGVQLDEHGAAIGYHVRTHHPDDDAVWGAGMPEWNFVERETEWGRPVMVHAFEADRAGQFRGVPPMAPILRKLKQMVKYDEAELQAALVNAVLAAFITSPGNHDDLAEAMTATDVAKLNLDRLSAYKEAPPRLQGGTAHFLYPGDEVTLTQPGHPNSGFEAFFRAGLRNVASTVGLTYEQLTMDWSQVNYSSARAALLEIWRGLTARKDMFAAQFMGQIYRAWLEEYLDRRLIKLPAKAPSFEAMPAAWAKADWIGPARGWVDPQKEAEAAGMRMSLGISSLEKECAEQGLDWKQVTRKRGRERRFLLANGLEPDPARVEAKIQTAKEEEPDQRDRREREEAA
ncbi:MULTISPECIES: phage portal protein [unclassified Mesorhizobium]|uniref:phage portal protein n=1 Tax=unclassified Mesorhizobium TaxID=325217 RepID=UPI001129490A|nr:MULTISPECIES: phage portal protein [unclassified Mesorhizobium]MCA0027346.1 phage portal protein [Mesorhizobium sp. B263B1A]TPJ98621.1 phage portal protein [Mesorhizobium sp. B2-5-12]TPK28783.1 phage portal protein [Mesorhizobium sp. B2-5-6]